MKPYSEIEYREDYLYMKTKGRFDFKTINKVLVDALNTVNEHGFHGILFDAKEMTGDLTTMQRYDLAKTMAEMASDILIKKKVFVHMAFVGTSPFIDPKKFGIVVARNRGVSLKGSDNYDEAKNWLETKIKAGQ